MGSASEQALATKLIDLPSGLSGRPSKHPFPLPDRAFDQVVVFRRVGNVALHPANWEGGSRRLEEAHAVPIGPGPKGIEALDQGNTSMGIRDAACHPEAGAAPIVKP